LRGARRLDAGGGSEHGEQRNGSPAFSRKLFSSHKLLVQFGLNPITLSRYLTTFYDEIRAGAVGRSPLNDSPAAAVNSTCSDDS
jgi:hypothetical protein